MDELEDGNSCMFGESLRTNTYFPPEIADLGRLGSLIQGEGSGQFDLANGCSDGDGNDPFDPLEC